MSGQLDLSVDRTSEVALGTQLIWKLRTAITTGALAPGARLPGLREVAEAAGVNANTVRSVFARLEDQGLVVSEHGRGTFVASDARHNLSLAETAETMLEQARRSGIDPRELAAALYVSPAVAVQPSAEQDPSERRSLREQIQRLELEIGRLDPLRSTRHHPAGEPQPRVLTTAELRGVRDGLRIRLERLRDQRRQWRVENEQLLAAEREEAAERAKGRPWRAGVWTGATGARVSWTAA